MHAIAKSPFRFNGNGIARDACFRPRQQTLFAQNAIEQSGFARIGTAHHGNAQRLGNIEFSAVFFIVEDFLFIDFDFIILAQMLFRHSGTYGIIELAQAFAMFGRNGERITKSQREGFVIARIALLAFGLVGEQQNGLAGTAHELRKMAVGGRHADARINDEENHIGLFNRRFRLHAHALRQNAFVILLKTRRVDNREAQIGQFAFALATVARHPRPVIDQREFFADEPIEQRRLADIRSADNGDCKRHETLLLATCDKTEECFGTLTDFCGCIRIRDNHIKPFGRGIQIIALERSHGEHFARGISISLASLSQWLETALQFTSIGLIQTQDRRAHFGEIAKCGVNGSIGRDGVKNLHSAIGIFA